MLHGVMFISVGCCRQLGAMLSAVAEIRCSVKNIAFINKVSVRGYVRYALSPDIIHTARCLL